jgi:hypothetical protein
MKKNCNEVKKFQILKPILCGSAACGSLVYVEISSLNFAET